VSAPRRPDPGCLLNVKVVPGARRDEVAGWLGSGDEARLKVRVSAPPEGGRANAAVCALVAGALGLDASRVSVVRGASSPQKTLRVEGADLADVRARLEARLEAHEG
jgi:uncharacterized protein (TIGR00251 family)